MKTFNIKASLYSHSVEFSVNAETLGQALKLADIEFMKIYEEANGIKPALTWSDRKIHAKENKVK